ncbi:MAG: sortase [Solirubrobacteraceae bacterium]|jgi:sortase A|nr:sortase [Solirubrobacteraceae bacterium]
MEVRRFLRGVSSVLIVAGVLMLADAGLTLAWQEPVTALLARLHQNQLGKDLRKLEATGPTPLERKALSHLKTDRQRVAFLARSLRRRLKRGDAAGRIKIAKIHANFVVVKGTDTESLKKGPGFYDNTPFPGARGTIAIAGHRTTYLAPFRHIDRLARGDDIEIDMPYARFHFRVERHRIVTPSSFWIIRRVRYDRLVLSACHPLYSAAKRIVVFARLVSVQQV